MEIKIALVDDHALFRKGIINGMKKYPDITIALQANNGIELLANMKDNPVDVILLDLLMPQMNGMTTLKEIRKINEDVKIIICTAHYEENEMLQLIEEKANGYLLKEPDPEIVYKAIQCCIHTGFYFNIATTSLSMKAGSYL